jgi:hypothetical protein
MHRCDLLGGRHGRGEATSAAASAVIASLPAAFLPDTASVVVVAVHQNLRAAASTEEHVALASDATNFLGVDCTRFRYGSGKRSATTMRGT